MTPAERALRSQLAAHTSWANTRDRTARTAPARQAAEDRFYRQARRQFPDLPAKELAIRAQHLKIAHMRRMALRSAQARRKKK